MGTIREITPVKLFCGFLYRDAERFENAKILCVDAFGETDYESSEIPFTHTNYYEKEFGKDLTRVFLSFKTLIAPDALSRTKHQTNEMERRLVQNEKRTVNIDPGYIALSKLALATTKDYYHRVYVGDGMFAEVTLHFKESTFQPFPWTYPDYNTSQYVEIFNAIRKIYKGQIADQR